MDLVYLDPPFNSNASYNVLFAEHNGTDSKAQIEAFEDTWRWDQASAQAYQETVEKGGKVADALRAFRTLLGASDVLAYLAMMAPRLIELRQALKPTGSLYLHCDPTASHYLRILMDAVFGVLNFRNEIIWRRTNAHNMKSRQFPRVHDTLLFYSKSDQYLWRPEYLAYSEAQLRRYKPDSTGRLFTGQDLTITSSSDNQKFEWRGSRPPANRGWAASLSQLEKWWAEGGILAKRDGTPRLDGLKVFLDEMPGKPADSIWTDIPRVANTSHERLGYPTQKPEALLERIISASSSEGDMVLDPFCGCGTAVVVAQRLGRHWIGIDITFEAIKLIKERLASAFGNTVGFKIVGEPTTTTEAMALAEQDPLQFQSWALGLVSARSTEFKKGADRGLDGRLYFHEDLGGESKQVVFSVKAGHVESSYVRDLRGVIEREQAEIGVLVSLESSTREMRKEAASGGFYISPWGRHPRLQLLTVDDLLDGIKVDMPPLEQVNITFKKAPRARTKPAKQIPMGLRESEPEK